MSTETKYLLETFISELTAFSTADILVHVQEQQKGITILSTPLNFEDTKAFKLDLPLNSTLNQVLKVAIQYQKTADVHSLCLAHHLFCWNFKGKNIQSPLFLFPLKAKINKVKQEVSFQVDGSEFYLNPFLLNALKKEFDLDLVHTTENVNDYVLHLKQRLTEAAFSFELKDFDAIGNFHYHRYEIIKDLEEIVNSGNINSLIEQLFGASSSNEFPKLDLSKKNCFDSDPDQEAIFKVLKEDNLVVQGPPGTGKSQLLANLLAKLLHEGSPHLLVSEKRTALSVLEQKLKTRQLHHFVFLADSNSKATDFTKKMKKTWAFLEQQQTSTTSESILLSEQLRDQLQLSFDKINSNPLLQYKSLRFFQQFEQEKNYEQIPFLSKVPDIDDWIQQKQAIKSLYEQFDNCSLLAHFRPSYLKHQSQFQLQIELLLKQHQNLQAFLPFNTLAEIDHYLKLQARIQLIENETGKKYFELLKSKTNQKKFQQLKRKFEQVNQAIEAIENEETNWKKIPSLTEIESWKKQLNHGSFIQKWLLQKQLKKRFVSAVDTTIALENIHRLLLLKQELLQTKSDLATFGIEQPEHELHLISYFMQQMNELCPNELNNIAEMNENLRNNILKHHSELHLFKRTFSEFFHFPEVKPIGNFLNELAQSIEKICVCLPLISGIHSSFVSQFSFASSFEEFEKMVLKANWIQLKSNFPELSHFDGAQLAQKLKTIQEAQHSEQDLFGQEIIQEKTRLFNRYQGLLLDSSRKLNESDKELKKRLKAGKALLVKEFAKSKQHKSIRELLQTDAEVWIKLLCPVFLATPGMVSKHFSLTTQFEFVLFDEASQITLPRALAAIQRSKRLIIAGDSQQMSPSQLFTGVKSSVDLLHQASYYFKSIGLKHHYRSEHPALIAFSNKYFYNNELIVYPSAERVEKPIEIHTIEHAIYENKCNLVEAKAIATQIEKEISSKNTLGIVAFSEQQLACIWKQLKPTSQQVLMERMEQNTLFFKTLEQVQGEECEHLLISFGYGKNKEGAFHKRFGPLNFSTGNKRLNVLFSRAIRKIDFFCSVSANDFDLSTNEAVNLFRQFLLYHSQQQTQEELQFPFNLKAKIHQKELTIQEISKKIPNVNELIILNQVMKKRAWKINYEV